jgi:hypothetical protein
MFKVGDFIAPALFAPFGEKVYLYRVIYKVSDENIEDGDHIYCIEVVQHHRLPVGRKMKFHSSTLHENFVIHKIFNYNNIWANLNASS